MATTTPFPFRNYMDREDDCYDIASHMVDMYEMSLRDEDKAGDVEDGVYYSGRVDALSDALSAMLEVPTSAWERWHEYKAAGMP